MRKFLKRNRQRERLSFRESSSALWDDLTLRYTRACARTQKWRRGIVVPYLATSGAMIVDNNNINNNDYDGRDNNNTSYYYYHHHPKY